MSDQPVLIPFVVEVTRTTGGYESTFRKLVEAENREAAELRALEGECHGFCDANDPDYDPEADNLYGYAYHGDDNFWVNEDTIAEAIVLFEVPEDTRDAARELFNNVCI